MDARYRQEVLNVVLAQLLQDRGVISAPESIIKGPLTSRRMPDVLVIFRGLRTLIEGEVADQADAATKALNAARRRVMEGIAHIGVAVVYPSELRSVPFDSLKSAMAGCLFGVAIITEAGPTDYVQGNIDYLESALRHAFEQLVCEDVVTQAATMIHAEIERFALACTPKRGIVGRMTRALGIREVPGEHPSEEKGRKSEIPERERTAVSRVGGLVLLNAMIFQEILSEDNHAVLGLQKISPKPRFQQHKLIEEFAEHWAFILEEINYYPIFHVAREVILSISITPFVLEDLERLARTAKDIVDTRVPLRHDLMGRVYHRLLSDAKYLGTYYTSIPAAALLLKLALRAEAGQAEWESLDQLGTLRVADLACGTGTLLMAAADAVTDNYISSAARKAQEIDFDQLQKVLAEEILYGYDVLPSAIHLTASTLALRAPHIPFLKMNLFSLPLGGPELRLGSIEFLQGRACQMAMDLFGTLPKTQRATGEAIQEVSVAPLPDLDLCVMNPPFTRSVGGNLLFGSVPEEERRLMQEKLKKLVKAPRNGVTESGANITAGLGSVFVAAAHPHIKPGGRIALVLPKALLSGVAWARTRRLINRHYRIEYLVASHDPQRWNFSESTNLSEVLLVAVKNGGNNSGQNDKVVAVNLWRNMTTAFEALAVAHTVTQNHPPLIGDGQGALEISLGRSKIGEAIAMPWKELKSRPDWLIPCAFAQSDLVRAACHLLQGRLWLPGYGEVAKISLCPLSDIGTLGPDRRDIHDGFALSQKVTAYPAFWGHDADAVYTLSQYPNRYLAPLPKAKEGRHLRKVEDLWPLAGSVVIAERVRLNTQNLVALLLSKPVLSNVWWPFSSRKRLGGIRREKALVLWLNSTLGLLVLLASREETEGPWIDFKKPTLHGMPVLALGKMSAKQVEALSSVYDRLADKTLLPFSQLTTDSVRAEIDKGIAQALRLPDFSILREMLGQEPVVCLRPL